MYHSPKTNCRRWRDKRVGVDLDKVSELQLLKTYLRVQSLKQPFEVKKTRHGHHFRIYKKHSIKQNFETRAFLGDDADRLVMDYNRLLQGDILSIDTLFEAKLEEGVVTKEENVNVLSLPFNSHFPAKKNGLNRSRR